MTDYYEAKRDQGKPRLDLIPSEWILGLGGVLTVGAEKYGPESWRTVPDAESRYMAALLRHYAAFHAGQRISDDGLHPLLQVAANALFLYSIDQAISRQDRICKTCTYKNLRGRRYEPCKYCYAGDQWTEGGAP